MQRRHIINNDSDGLTTDQLTDLEQTSTVANETHIGNQCAICLDIFEERSRIITLSCDHFFHTNCISRWYSDNPTCPVCRHRTDTTEQDGNNNNVQYNIQMSFNQLYMLTTQIDIEFVYPNRTVQNTRWSIHNTVIDIFSFIQRSCPQLNTDIMLQNENITFKTTESYSLLNKSLIMFNIHNDISFRISFLNNQ